MGGLPCCTCWRYPWESGHSVSVRVEKRVFSEVWFRGFFFLVCIVYLIFAFQVFQVYCSKTRVPKPVKIPGLAYFKSLGLSQLVTSGSSLAQLRQHRGTTSVFRNQNVKLFLSSLRWQYAKVSCYFDQSHHEPSQPVMRSYSPNLVIKNQIAVYSFFLSIKLWHCCESLTSCLLYSYIYVHIHRILLKDKIECSEYEMLKCFPAQS